MNPDLESEKAVNPFDLWQGANFKLKMTRQSGFPNYDESTFLAPAPLSDDDAELEKIWKSEYSLKEIIDPKNFKSYDQLKARLQDVLGFGDRPTPTPVAKTVEEDVPWQEDKPVVAAKKATKAPVVEDDDEDLAMFRELADLDD
jgi:gp32 DNA binding protein like